MSQEDFKRKLTAILSDDVVGYSRLMGDDEAATVKTLETYKGVMFSLIKQHRGRVVDSPKEGIAKLHQLYNDDSNLSEVDITEVAILAAYFGYPECAMDAMEKGIEIDTKGLFKI